MTKSEKEETGRLPEAYRPLGAWGYLGYALLFSLPVIGWVFIVIFSVSGANLCRRGFARFYILVWIIGIVVSAVVVALVMTGVLNFAETFGRMAMR